MGDEDNNSESSGTPGVPTGKGNSAGESPEGTADPLLALERLEGWRVDGEAARVHYSGATDRYSIEYYHPSECVLYWKVPPEDAGNTAVPVGRNTVPAPLRERIREDLAEADIDPEIEQRKL